MNMLIESFKHSHAAHCESGVASSMLTHHGVRLSEAMAFGLSAAMAFAYLPFVKFAGFPLIAFRMPPKAILKGMVKPFKMRFHFETFRDPQKGMRRLDELLAEGRIVGIQTSAFWLPYFPADMRFHFNAHNLIVYGKEGDDYLISDPVAETPQRCDAENLRKARFATGLMAPKGLLYYPEEIGTGGAGFRFLYAAFLQEAADITGRDELKVLAEKLNVIGDGWREFALKAVRMIKGREAFDPKLLAQMLHKQADDEKEFFQALKKAIA
jgi:hypothetical protein